MYTDEMRRAFHSVQSFCPKGFALQVIDNEHFITLKANEKTFMSLTNEDRVRAVDYMVRSKQALEGSGAIVLLVREGGEEL
jgi:hypothetical protein